MPSTTIEEAIATTIQKSLRHWEEEAREAELYTEAEAAKSLKMSQRNLQELRRTGQIEWTQGSRSPRALHAKTDRRIRPVEGETHDELIARLTAPTELLPGSSEKLELMAERAMQNVPPQIEGDLKIEEITWRSAEKLSNATLRPPPQSVPVARQAKCSDTSVSELMAMEPHLLRLMEKST